MQCMMVYMVATQQCNAWWYWMVATQQVMQCIMILNDKTKWEILGRWLLILIQWSSTGINNWRIINLTYYPDHIWLKRTKRGIPEIIHWRYKINKTTIIIIGTKQKVCNKRTVWIETPSQDIALGVLHMFMHQF